ncbi:unnamed protein product [Rotaria sordida]|uniref:TRAF-type domain-containing protein n=1 Tax=Rotaria sordida TaxID=392033 RepID=A0A814WV56_9BILA|nr:unnamed protein product [Rotaria sordida]CAF1207222.1 unnamed protein product [Rotaria sordida]
MCRGCTWPLYPTIQLDCCGQRICKDCIPYINTEFKCPSCGVSNININPDKGHTREVENLVVNCPECDCTWDGLFRNLKDHLKSHCTLQCKNCNEKFIWTTQLENHQRERCVYRTVPCELAPLGCSKEVPISDIEKHYLDSEHQQYLLAFIKDKILHLYNGIPKLTSQNTPADNGKQNNGHTPTTAKGQGSIKKEYETI